MHRSTRDILLTLAALSTCGTGNLAIAQKPDNWPNRPIRLIVPFPPGGGTDLVGRSVGAKLSEALGQKLVVALLGTPTLPSPHRNSASEVGLVLK